MTSALNKGRFIVFEGGEGAGKTTQIGLLEAHLRSLSIPVHKTREPGGTPNAEALREVIVSHRGSWTAMSELLVMSAARHDHLTRVIKPALEAGQWVLCDRFMASSVAYQSATGELSSEFIRSMNTLVVEGLKPDLTFTLDLPAAVGLQRAFMRQEQSRFEAKGIDYHEAVRKAFLTEAARSPGNVIIDATGTQASIHHDIKTYLEAGLGVPYSNQVIDE